MSLVDTVSDKRSIKKALMTFSSGTVLSRVTGLVRDMMAAAFFTSSQNDIWVVAYRIPNLLRGILAEGSSNMAIVPVLSDSLREGEEKAKKVANSIFTVFLLVLSAVTLIGIIFTPTIVRLMVPEFAEIPGKMQTTIQMTRMIFPYVILIGLTAFCMGVLNTRGHFFASSIHPVFLNISFIIFIALSYMFNPSVKAIAWAALVGGTLQILIHLPYLKKTNFVPHLTSKLEKKELIKTWKLFYPSLLSISVVPITVAMNTYFASIVGSGVISHFFWADRLVQFPIGVFAVALGVAILPVLSKQWDDKKKLRSNYSYAFRICTLIMLPVTAGIMAISMPLVKVLFYRGNFGMEDTISTASALLFLSLALFPSGIIRITVPLFYSLKDSLRPAIFSMVGLAVNLTICFLSVHKLGIQGIALAVAGASIFNALCLLIYFNKKHLKIIPVSFIFTIKVLIITSATFFGAYMIVKARDWNANNLFIEDAGFLLLAITCGAVMFGLSSIILGMRKELHKI